jgi:hypothetical protein
MRIEDYFAVAVVVVAAVVVVVAADVAGTRH